MSYPIVVIRQANQTPIYLSVRQKIEVGRECDGVLLSDFRVSRKHLELSLTEDGRVQVRDLGSTNGTTADGKPVKSPVVMHESMSIQLGDTKIELEAASGRPKSKTVPQIQGPAKTDPATSRPTSADAFAAPAPMTAAGGGSPHLVSGIIQVAEQFQADPDILSIQSVQGSQETVTIVFSDIQKSTERNRRLGDMAWLDILSRHEDLIRHCVRRHDGKVVKNTGDGFMLCFGSSLRAIQCMSDVQQQLQEQSGRDLDRTVFIRVGIHAGEVIKKRGDFFGQHVNKASRIGDQAEVGEILVSQVVKSLVTGSGVSFGEPRTVDLSGLGQEQVYPVDW